MWSRPSWVNSKQPITPTTEQLQTVPLQNRVTALGEVVASPARGLFTGNRGIIHDGSTKTLLRRRWTTKAWIVCVIDFRGRRREVMSPGTWTELFFLDEVTAFAAGHRPCYYCRRSDATHFAECARLGGGVEEARAPAMDKLLHAQRLASGGTVGSGTVHLKELPDGTVIASGEAVYALREHAAFPWSLSGYGPPVSVASLSDSPVTVITPALTRAALAQGYAPRWHPSIDER